MATNTPIVTNSTSSAEKLLFSYGFTPKEACVGSIVVFLPLLALGITALALPTGFSKSFCGLNQHPMAPTPNVGSILTVIVTVVAAFGLGRIVLSNAPKTLIATAVTFFVATLLAIGAHVVQVFGGDSPSQSFAKSSAKSFAKSSAKSSTKPFQRDMEGGLRSLQCALGLLLATLLVWASIDALAAALLLPAAGWLLGVYRLHTFLMQNNREALRLD